jgi:hypothetical protein
MFDEWKRAWRGAVDRFWSELDDAPPGSGLPPAMRREVVTARRELARLERELQRARVQAAAEREEAAVCRRREGLASAIADAETRRVAADFAVRHEERAALLERKAEVLAAELDLRSRELAEMEAALREKRLEVPAAEDDPEELARDTAEFDRLERDARQRAAEARLDELKRRMQ